MFLSVAFPLIVYWILIMFSIMQIIDAFAAQLSSHLCQPKFFSKCFRCLNYREIALSPLQTRTATFRDKTSCLFLATLWDIPPNDSPNTSETHLPQLENNGKEKTSKATKRNWQSQEELDVIWLKLTKKSAINRMFCENLTYCLLQLADNDIFSLHPPGNDGFILSKRKGKRREALL